MEKEKGQSLLEVLIALAVIILVLVALIRGIITSIKSSDFAKKSSQASSYAQEGMENIRAYRDSSWANLWGRATPDSGTTYGLAGTTPSLNCSSGTIPDTPFTRCVTLKLISDTPPKVEATLTVSWTDSSGTHQSTIVSYFTQWQ